MKCNKVPPVGLGWFENDKNPLLFFWMEGIYSKIDFVFFFIKKKKKRKDKSSVIGWRGAIDQFQNARAIQQQPTENLRISDFPFFVCSGSYGHRSFSNQQLFFFVPQIHFRQFLPCNAHSI